MATVIETHGHSDIDHAFLAKERKWTVGFRILRAASDAEALLAVDAVKLPMLSYGLTTLIYDSIKLNHVEAETFDAEVLYIHPEAQQSNESEQGDTDQPQISISTTGGTTHITHSYETIRSYPPEVKDKHKQAINVERTAKGEIKIKGTEVVVPALKVTVSAKVNPPADPWAWGRILARRTGRVNSGNFRGFFKWELLFLGARITGKLREKWTVDFDFEGSESILESDNFKIGNLGPIVKEGHAYLWVEWQQAIKQVFVYNSETGESLPKDELVVEPIGIFIEKIYHDFPLSELGLT